jgi:hypothetical protein
LRQPQVGGTIWPRNVLFRYIGRWAILAEKFVETYTTPHPLARDAAPGSYYLTSRQPGMSTIRWQRIIIQLGGRDPFSS